MADNRSHDERKRAIHGIIEFFNERKAYTDYPGLLPVIKSLTKKLEKINSLCTRRADIYTSDFKKLSRHDLAVAAHHVSAGICAYASITKNTALKNAVYYSVSDLFRPEENVMMARIRQVQHAFQKVKNPGHYGLTNLVLQNFKECLDHFKKTRNQPLIHVKKHAQALRHADLLMRDCFDILETQLDPLMVAIGFNDEKLLDKYNNHRRVKKEAGRRRKYIKRNKTAIKALKNAATVESNDFKPDWEAEVLMLAQMKS